jgi:hypothetical protein
VECRERIGRRVCGRRVGRTVNGHPCKAAASGRADAGGRTVFETAAIAPMRMVQRDPRASATNGRGFTGVVRLNGETASFAYGSAFRTWSFSFARG